MEVFVDPGTVFIATDRRLPRRWRLCPAKHEFFLLVLGLLFLGLHTESNVFIKFKTCNVFRVSYGCSVVVLHE